MGLINALLLYFINIDAYIKNMKIACNSKYTYVYLDIMFIPFYKSIHKNKHTFDEMYATYALEKLH